MSLIRHMPSKAKHVLRSKGGRAECFHTETYPWHIVVLVSSQGMSTQRVLSIEGVKVLSPDVFDGGDRAADALHCAGAGLLIPVAVLQQCYTRLHGG